MKTIRIAQIGICHDHAALVLQSALSHPERFEVVGYVPEDTPPYEEESADIAERFRERFPDLPVLTLDRVFTDKKIDAVLIESRERDLVYYAQMAADHGLHVHMDKPGGESDSAFTELVRTLQNKNLVFSLGYMYRQNPAVKEAFSLIREGKIGKVVAAEAQMNCFHTVEKRRWLGNFKGGMLFFLGCHLLDLLYQLQGEPSEVIPLSCSTGLSGVKSEDFGMALLRYPSGVSFVKTSAVEPGGFLRRQLVIVGTEGQIEIKPLEMMTGEGEGFGNIKSTIRVITKKDIQRSGWNAEGTVRTSPPSERYANMLLDFADYVQNRRINPYSYEYELSLFRLILRACHIPSDLHNAEGKHK